MLYLQYRNMWSIFDKHKNFECIKKKKKLKNYATIFHILHLSSKFQSLRPNNNFFLKLNRSPLSYIYPLSIWLYAYL